MATDNCTDDNAHQITRRALLRLALATPIATGLLALPAAPVVAAPRPVAPRTQRVPLGSDNLRRIDREQHRRDLPDVLAELPGERTQTDDPTDPAAELEVYASDEIPTDTFRVAGFTWEGDEPTDATLLIRTRVGRGPWSEWVRLHDDDHGPDPDSPEAATARRGTDALIVDEADAVEVRVESPAGVVPSDLAVELIDPGESPADADVGTVSASPQAEPHRPTIRTRADWGADESMRGDPEYAEVRGTFVHHTAGSNTYNQGDVPAIIRGIYAYHVNGRGWRDIGYNFLIDKFGRTWEGRYGGIDRAVIGAHVSGYNSYSSGMSVLGTYTSKEPEPAVLTALQQLIEWKLAVHGVNLSGRVAYPGLSTLPKIAGHRDGGSTECPGTRLYARLGTLSARVDAAVWRHDAGKLYLFSGDQYVRFTSVGNGPDASYPRPIAGNWNGLPTGFEQGIDAALWRESRGVLYFFKGSQYVRFSNGSTRVDLGYPKPIAGNWPGLPTSFRQGIDAALWRQSNRKIYFFKGSQYVRYSNVARGVDRGYPKPIAGNWPGLPATFRQGIDAALMRRDNGKIYFFKGAAYVRYSRVAAGIDASYPRWIDQNWMRFPL